ncbi:hypothetical protein BDK51DRAFT_26962, partial [Blyttiomyces helicus]
LHQYHPNPPPASSLPPKNRTFREYFKATPASVSDLFRRCTTPFPTRTLPAPLRAAPCRMGSKANGAGASTSGEGVPASEPGTKSVCDGGETKQEAATLRLAEGGATEEVSSRAGGSARLRGCVEDGKRGVLSKAAKGWSGGGPGRRPWTGPPAPCVVKKRVDTTAGGWVAGSEGRLCECVQDRNGEVGTRPGGVDVGDPRLVRNLTKGFGINPRASDQKKSNNGIASSGGHRGGTIPSGTEIQWETYVVTEAELKTMMHRNCELDAFEMLRMARCHNIFVNEPIKSVQMRIASRWTRQLGDGPKIEIAWGVHEAGLALSDGSRVADMVPTLKRVAFDKRYETFDRGGG